MYLISSNIFIDGEVGTTGLKIRAELDMRKDVEIISIPEKLRKNPDARAEILNSVDLAILCLPDDAAKEAVDLIKNPNVKLIDASTAHRTHPEWVYGFPELNKKQSKIIAASKRVTNPGCYALASIAIIHPLVSSGIISNDYPVTINAISGYSGGGRTMITNFEEKDTLGFTKDAFRVYALSLSHKHVPEIQKHANLNHRPLFLPSVGRFSQGMIVQLPIQLWSLPGKPKAQDLLSVLKKHYRNQPLITVVERKDTEKIKNIQPEALNGTNELKLYVFTNNYDKFSVDEGQVVIMALLDNLGKGASGQAVQNMDLMLNLK